jgi:hypothetical protein
MCRVQGNMCVDLTLLRRNLFKQGNCSHVIGFDFAETFTRKFNTIDASNVVFCSI